jgi:hypothetical protein
LFARVLTFSTHVTSNARHVTHDIPHPDPHPPPSRALVRATDGVSSRRSAFPSRPTFPTPPRLHSFRTGTGRYPPQPKFEPFAFYSCFRLGNREQAKIIMATDPYYWTQDNGVGGPVHFATMYKQIDMLHHILRNCPCAVNQQDSRGLTPLHRAAYLAQHNVRWLVTPRNGVSF